MFKKLTLFAALLMAVSLGAGTLWAQGEAGASSLIIPPGARANAMGQSYVAIADDATAIWWNPAGLAFIHRSMDLMHSQLVPTLASDVFFEFFGGAWSVEGLGTVGASLDYLTYGSWEGTDPNNVYLGKFTSWEAAPTVGAGVKIMEGLGVGMNLKFVYIDLAPAQATIEGQKGVGHSVAVDLGALWKVPSFKLGSFEVSRLNLGLAVSNLGPSITFINRDQAAPLPRDLRVGFAYTPVASNVAQITVASDYERPIVEFERSPIYHVGAEFMYVNLIAVRAGYINDRDGAIRALSYGLGVMFNKRYRLDWASVPQAGEIGNVQRWSFGVTF
jgi:hypothetical protein